MISKHPDSMILGSTLLFSLALGVSCVQETPGVYVQADLQLSQEESSDLKLEEGYLNINTWELLPCSTSAFQVPPLLGASIALAHTDDTPTKWGTPQMLSLKVEDVDSALPLGRVEPPPTPYCTLLLQISPADGDGLGLPESPDLAGLTFFLKGQYKPEGETDFIDFFVQSTSSTYVVLPLGTEGIMLSASTPWAHLLLTLDPSVLLSGIPADLDPEALERQILLNIPAAITYNF